MAETYYPKESNIGQRCSYWGLGKIAAECCFPKVELQCRTSCQGTIDDVCLNIVEGRQLKNSTSILLMTGVRISIPSGSLLPPGQIE